MKEKEFEFYTKSEIKELLLNNEKLVYADNGIDEVVVRYDDLPDFIVDMSRNMDHSCKLKVYKYPAETMAPILTTIGEFLDKCDLDVRKDIIDRLIQVQTVKDTKKYKIIDENDLELARNEIKKSVAIRITNIRKTDFEDIRCNAIISMNGKVKASIIARFEIDEYPDWKNSQKEYKEIIADNWEMYIHLPKISQCSKLLREIYDNVCESDANMCHIDLDDWKEHYADRYTKEDLDVLYSEIKKYNLEDFLQLYDKEYILENNYSTKEELENYKPEYIIVGYGDLEICFNDDRNLVRAKDMER